MGDAERIAALIGRVEKATGPDREIDALVHCALNPEYEVDRRGEVIFVVKDRTDRGAFYTSARGYTASLDAAMTLVPEGWWIQYLGEVIGGWHCRIETQGTSLPKGMRFPLIKTAALCVTAACLRAHLEQSK